jgi:hypothetical protein
MCFANRCHCRNAFDVLHAVPASQQRHTGVEFSPQVHVSQLLPVHPWLKCVCQIAFPSMPSRCSWTIGKPMMQELYLLPLLIFSCPLCRLSARLPSRASQAAVPGVRSAGGAARPGTSCHAGTIYRSNEWTQQQGLLLAVSVCMCMMTAAACDDVHQPRVCTACVRLASRALLCSQTVHCPYAAAPQIEVSVFKIATCYVCRAGV